MLLAVTPAAAAIPVEGRVIDGEGRALAAARLALTPLRSGYQRSLELLASSPAPAPVAETRTGDDGRFRLEAPEAGLWDLAIEAEGFVPMEIRLAPLVERHVRPDLWLRRAKPIEVRVVDPEGRPAAGASVHLFPADRAMWWSEHRALPSTRSAVTDPEGAARLIRGEGESVRLQAFAAGYLESDSEVTEADKVTLKLRAGVEAAVEVLEADDTPAAHALVTGRWRWPLARTGDDGRARLRVAADGETPLRALSVDDRDVLATFSGADAGIERPFTLRLPALERASGRVVDVASREPIAGAWISGRDAMRIARSDRDGRFTLETPAGGERRYLEVAAPGYASAYAPWQSGAEIVVGLERVRGVEGRVVDGEGEPVAGAEVRAERALSAYSVSYGPDIDPAVTDEGGVFRLTGLERGRAYRLIAEAEGYARAELDLEDPAAESAAEPVLVLERGASAFGRVDGPDGGPVAGAAVTLRSAVGSGRIQLRLRALVHRDRMIVAEAVTDEEGVFELEHLPDGAFNLEIRATGLAPLTAAELRLAPDGGPHDLGTFALEPAAPIEGRVSDRAGSPVEGARIRVEPEELFAGVRLPTMPGEAPAAVTDAEGRFSIEDRRSGERLDLRIEREGFAPARVPGVEAPTARPLAIRLEAASRVSGRVVDRSAKPVAGAWVRLERAGAVGPGGQPMGSEQLAGARTGDDGQFRLDDLPAGPALLKVLADGWIESELAEIEIPRGGELDGLEVVLDKGAAVSGRVLGPDGEPVHAAHILVRTGPGGFTGSGDSSDVDGRYRLEGVAPGWQTLMAMHSELGQITRQLEVAPGDNRLDFRYEPGAEVGGRVVDDISEPVPGAELRLVSEEAGWSGRVQRSASDGTFRFDAVPDGRYRLFAEKAGYARGESGEPIEVSGAPVPGLEIRLTAGGAIVGRVVGLEPGELASVTIFGHNQTGSHETGGAAYDGSYRLEHLPPGEWTVAATAQGSGRTTRGTVSLAPGQPEALLDLEFGGGLELAGLLWMGDEPAAGLLVQASGLDVLSVAVVRSDRLGRFRLEGLEAGRHRLRVQGQTGALLHERQVDLVADLDLEIRLETGSLAGEVVNAATGEPLAGALVTLELDDAAGGDDRFDFQLGAGASSDARGRFRILDAPVGTYRLRATKDGYAVRRIELALAAGERREDLRLALEPTRGLTLRVASADGRTVQQVRAALLDPSGRPVASGRFHSDADGRLHLTQAPAGRWRLLVAAHESAIASLEVEAPGEVAVRLDPGATVDVEVPELAAGAELATLTVASPAGESFRQLDWVGGVQAEWRMLSGRTRLSGLPPGEWLLRAEAPDGRVWQSAVSVGPGETRRAVLD